jgi:uncharacterized membrane protein
MEFARSAERRQMAAELYSSEDRPRDRLVNGSANSAQPTLECPNCETVMPANAAFCPGCGWSMTPIAPADRAIAAAAYLTWIAGAVILSLPALRRQRFVRFHAWQSVLLWGMFSILTSVALLLSNVAAAMVFLVLGILAALAMLFLWIVLTVKAWQGERFELPLFGSLAERLG